MGSVCSKTRVVVLPLDRVERSVPLASPRYAVGVVMVTVKGAFWAARSLHGNQVHAPLGWAATTAPSWSTSQPTGPQGEPVRPGLPR